MVKFLQTLLLLASFASFGQTISGRVTTESNEGLPGVSVLIKGTTSGTSTDVDGRYSLNVAGIDNPVLVYTYVGFMTQEVAVGNRTVIDVALAEDEVQLGEVVVTALGVEKKEERLGFSVTKVDGDLMTQARETNVANSLVGRVAGLDVSTSNGGPGSTSRILLRGMTSFNATSPLFVINGVPLDNTQRGASGQWGGSDRGDGIQNINPDDIEDMTVLKGAAASALYGARAANGVIIINTKKGATGGDFEVQYNSNYVLDKAINLTDFQYEYGQGVNGLKPTTAAGALTTGAFSWGAPLDGSSVIQFDGVSRPYSAVTDNIDRFYRTGSTFTNTISLSKGGQDGSFRFSMSNMDNESILRNSGLKRNTFNLNVDQGLGSKLRVGVTANYVLEEADNKPYLSDGPLNANNVYALATSLDQQTLAPGYFPDQNGAEMTWRDDIFVTNPWFVVNQGVNDQSRKRLISIAQVKYDITDWMFIQGRAAWDVSNDDILQVTPWGTAYTQDRRGSLGTEQKSEISEFNTDILLAANKSLNNDLNLDVSLGANLRRRTTESINIGGGPFILPYFYSFNNVVNFNRGYGFSELENQSAYYSVELAYKSFLTVTTTGRYDAFSTLPASDNSIFTPSLSGSFIFSELVDIPALSYGKLRVSWGQTSGEPGDPYITSQYYSLNNSIYGSTTVGNFGGRLPNLFLKPFTLTEYEIGTALKFFNGRAGLDVAYFNRTTEDEILIGALSPATGFTQQYIGTGSTQNQGVELLLTGTPVNTLDFSWDVSLNYTIVNNEVLEIYGPESSNTTLNLGTYRPLNANTALVKGLPGPQVMAYDYQRTSSGEIIVNASGVPLRGDLNPQGTVLPTSYGGLNNSFTYKGVNLSFLIDGKFGHKILSATSFYTTFNGLHKQTLEGREGGIQVDGVFADETPNNVTTPAQTYWQGLAQNVSSLHVLDGDFIKLRQVTLGYTIPGRVFGSAPIQSVSLSFVARNLLLLFSKADNIDPESAFRADLNYAGIEGNSLPSARTFGFNLNVKFK